MNILGIFSISIIYHMLHRMQQSIPKVICIAAPPNKLHQCSIDELTIKVPTADVHLNTVPCTFDGVSMDSSYWFTVWCSIPKSFRARYPLQRDHRKIKWFSKPKICNQTYLLRRYACRSKEGILVDWQGHPTCSLAWTAVQIELQEVRYSHSTQTCFPGTNFRDL